MSRFLLCAIITALVVLGSTTNVSLAGPYWERLPTDSEIQQAAERFTVPNRSILDSRVFKYHDPTESDYPIRANGVGLVYRVPNPDYDPANVDQPDLECGQATLYWWPDRGGWVFVDTGGGRRLCFSSIDTLNVLANRYLGTRYRLGWIGGPPPSENRPPTVSLSYSPQNPTPNDTIYFTTVTSDPDGDDLTYRWFLNGVEQTNATAPRVQWANPREGTYTMRVVVSDGKGGMAEDSIEFTVQPARPRYVIMKGTGEFQGEEPLAFVEKIEVNGKITESRTSLYKGAYVKTGPGVEIVIRFASGVVTRVKENTHYEIEEAKFSGTPQAVIYTRLIEGLMDFWFKGRELKQKFEIEANRVIVGIKGTEGTIKLISGITTVTVTEGEVEVRDTITGAVSTVRAGETATFGGTPPPSGAKTIEQAIDADGDGIINDLEMLQALQYWIKQQIVPGTNKTIDDLTMLSLLQKWIKGTPVR
jgi:hypothetical protein